MNEVDFCACHLSFFPKRISPATRGAPRPWIARNTDTSQIIGFLTFEPFFGTSVCKSYGCARIYYAVLGYFKAGHRNLRRRRRRYGVVNPVCVFSKVRFLKGEAQNITTGSFAILVTRIKNASAETSNFRRSTISSSRETSFSRAEMLPMGITNSEAARLQSTSNCQPSSTFLLPPRFPNFVRYVIKQQMSNFMRDRKPNALAHSSWIELDL